MTLNIKITYLDNNFINSSKSSKNYHIHAAYAVCSFFFSNAEIRKPDSLSSILPSFFEKTCEDHAPTITIDHTGSSIYVSRTNRYGVSYNSMTAITHA